MHTSGVRMGLFIAVLSIGISLPADPPVEEIPTNGKSGLTLQQKKVLVYIPLIIAAGTAALQAADPAAGLVATNAVDDPTWLLQFAWWMDKLREGGLIGSAFSALYSARPMWHWTKYRWQWRPYYRLPLFMRPYDLNKIQNEQLDKLLEQSQQAWDTNEEAYKALMAHIEALETSTGDLWRTHAEKRRSNRRGRKHSLAPNTDLEEWEEKLAFLDSDEGRQFLLEDSGKTWNAQFNTLRAAEATTAGEFVQKFNEAVDHANTNLIRKEDTENQVSRIHSKKNREATREHFRYYSQGIHNEMTELPRESVPESFKAISTNCRNSLEKLYRDKNEKLLPVKGSLVIVAGAVAGKKFANLQSTADHGMSIDDIRENLKNREYEKLKISHDLPTQVETDPELPKFYTDVKLAIQNNKGQIEKLLQSQNGDKDASELSVEQRMELISDPSDAVFKWAMVTALDQRKMAVVTIRNHFSIASQHKNLDAKQVSENSANLKIFLTSYYNELFNLAWEHFNDDAQMRKLRRKLIQDTISLLEKSSISPPLTPPPPSPGSPSASAGTEEPKKTTPVVGSSNNNTASDKADNSALANAGIDGTK